MIAWGRVIAALVMCAGAACQVLHAAPTDAATEQPSPLLYRRHLMPEELIAEQGAGYLPMSRATFEAALKESQADNPLAAPGQIARATYRAKLVGESLLEGTAELDVELRGESPASVPLEPCTVAIGKPRWKDLSDVALSSGLDPSGKFAVIVDRSDTIEFPWSTKVIRSKSGTLEAVLGLPSCALSQLEIELPSHLILAANEAIVRQKEETASDEATRLWHVDAGGLEEVALRILPRMQSGGAPPLIFVRESLSYRVTTAGIELLATLRLDIPQRPINQLVLDVTPGTRVAQATLQRKSARVEPIASLENGNAYRLSFSEPQHGNDLELVLNLVGPVTLGEEFEPPVITVRDAHWQTGTATFEFVEPLLLASVDSREGIGRKVEPLPLPQRGELWQFQCHGPDRGWRMLLLANVREVTAESGLSLRFSESVLSGQFVADLNAIRGETFEVRGRVLSPWIVDSVQTDPPENLESFNNEGAGGQVLVVRFKRAIRPGQPTRLLIRGHLRNPTVTRPAQLSALRFVRLQEVTQRNGIVAVTVEPPLKLAVSGDQQATRLDPQKLAKAEMDRIGAAPSFAFAEGPGLNGVTIAISPEQPRYSADIEIQERLNSQVVTESYRIRVTPENSHVARLVVRFSQMRATPPAWRLLDVPENAITARRIEPTDEAPGQELWEITALRPLNAPFTIQATRELKLQSEIAVPLASLPEAVSQKATVEVLCSDGLPLEITTKNVSATPPARVSSSQVTERRGSFRYVPSQDAGIYLARLPVPESFGPAWIWLSQLTSRITSGNDTRHEARFFVENKGLSSIAIRLPERTKLLTVQVDGSEVDPDSRESDGRLIVPISKETRFPLISLSYTSEQPAFTVATIARPVWPELSLPNFERRWDIWVPPELSVAADLAAPTSTWDERLFGTQLLGSSAPAFNPLRLEDWQQFHVRLMAWLGDSGPVESTFTTRSIGPWQDIPDDASAFEYGSGWKRFAKTHGSQEMVRVVVYSQSVVQAFGWAGLLITFGVLATFRHAIRWRLAVMLISLAAVVLVPEELLPIARGVFYGAILAWLLVLVPSWSFSRRPSSESQIASTRSITTPAATVSLVLAIVACATASALFAQEPEAAPRSEPAKRIVHPVLIPVDENQQPAGDYVYVPKELFEELHLRAAKVEHASQGPLLTVAKYEIELGSAMDAMGGTQLRSLVAEYELNDVPAHSQVKLPLRRDSVRVSDARVDGESAAFEWDKNGHFLIVAIETEGSRSLRLNLRPAAANETATGFAIPIPAVPRATATAKGAIDLQFVDFPTARGKVDHPSATMVTADLGPAGQLEVSWGPPPVTKAVDAEAHVAELFWLQVQPNSIIVRSKFRFAFRGTRATFVDIEADPRLRLLPPAVGESLHVEELNESGVRVLRFRLDETHGQESTLDVSFALSGSLGNLRLPHLKARASRRSPVWLAANVAEGISGELLPANQTSSLSVDQFMQSWSTNGGKDPDRPAWAVELPEMETVWQLAVRPQSADAAVHQELDLSVGLGQTSLSYEASFSLDHGALLQQTFTVPEGFSPREVVVIHDDVNRLLRWLRSDRGTLTVFFTSPLTGNFRIWIKGDVATPRNSQVRISTIAAAANEQVWLVPDRVRLFRHSDVNVKVDSTPGLVPETSVRESTYHVGLGRLAGVFLREASSQSGSAAVAVTISPNRPRVQGSMITALESQEGQWSAETSLRLQIRAGSIDLLRLRWPVGLDTPHEVSGGAEITEEVVPGEPDRILSIRLSEPTSRLVELRLKSRFRVNPEAIQAPDIQLLDLGEVARFLVLPRTQDGRALAWETSGLQAADLPAMHRIDEDLEADSDVYQAMSPRSRAFVKSADRVLGSPHVHLSDYRLQWFASGDRVGIAAFDVDPAGLRELTIKTPPGFVVVHLTVGAIPVPAKEAGDNTWKVLIGPVLLPQHVEVIFAGKVPNQSTRRQTIEFEAPYLPDLPCSTTLWTIRGPRESGAGVPLLSHVRATDREVAEQRLASARALLETVEPSASRALGDDVTLWRDAQQSWIEQLERNLEQLKKSESSASGQVLSGSSGPRFDLASVWAVPSYQPSSIVHVGLKGQSPSLVVEYRSSIWRDWIQRASILGGLLLAIVLIPRIPGKRAIKRTVVRYPYFALGLIGALLWAVVTPSVLGLTILVVTALLSLRPAWRTKPA